MPEEGWFCPPTLAVDLPDDSPVNREEIFGPLLAVTRGRGRGRGLRRGRLAAVRAHRRALLAQPGDRRARGRAALPVGNLYVNRGITGAMVGRQPFGGNRRSGIGSKAGGPDYLLQFVEPRVVTENTMRHGIPVE